jgi:hypothetical protein
MDKVQGTNRQKPSDFIHLNTFAWIYLGGSIAGHSHLRNVNEVIFSQIPAALKSCFALFLNYLRVTLISKTFILLAPALDYWNINIQLLNIMLFSTPVFKMSMYGCFWDCHRSIHPSEGSIPGLGARMRRVAFTNCSFSRVNSVIQFGSSWLDWCCDKRSSAYSCICFVL